jgi:hypothetical protein
MQTNQNVLTRVNKSKITLWICHILISFVFIENLIIGFLSSPLMEYHFFSEGRRDISILLNILSLWFYFGKKFSISSILAMLATCLMLVEMWSRFVEAGPSM